MDRKSRENGPLNRSTESIWTNLSWSTTGMDTLRATRPSNGLHRFLMQIRGLVTFAEGWEEMNSCWS